MRITSILRGSCWSSSLAAGRDDAWRCMRGNYIFDPCFSSPKAQGVVLCVVSPWSKSGVEIVLTKRLPNPYAGRPSTTGLPWAIQTSAGLRCGFVTRRHGCATGRASQLRLRQQRMVVGVSLPQLGAVDNLHCAIQFEAPLEASQDRRCLVLIPGTPRLREGGVFLACPGRGWPRLSKPSSRRSGARKRLEG